MTLDLYYRMYFTFSSFIRHLDFLRSWNTKMQFWRVNFRQLKTRGSEKLWALSGQLPAAIRTHLKQILPGVPLITPTPAGSPEGSPGPIEKGEQPKYEKVKHTGGEEKYSVRALLKWVSQIMRKLFPQTSGHYRSAWLQTLGMSRFSKDGWQRETISALLEMSATDQLLLRQSHMKTIWSFCITAFKYNVLQKSSLL